MTWRLGWIVLSLVTVATTAQAADPVGEWARVDGKAHVRIAPCGDLLCGTLTSVRDPKAPAKVGQKVFYEMKADGDGAWSGKAFNPDDGNEYTGKLILNGASLVTKGCALAGLICKSVEWTRIH